jgi:glycosyltransferase involved in cell wall biosynthesis
MDDVKLLGNRNDIPRLLSIADSFVFPSHYEGLPGALIEAMMAKVPIIASRIPENLECVNDSSATLHGPGDIQDLAKAIHTVLLSPNEFKNKAQKAHSDALLKFNLASIASQYEETYDKLLENI